MAYSTLATQVDTPTAGPDSTYFAAIAANETALLLADGARISSVSAQTMTASATTKLNLGTVSWDSHGSAYTGTANRITIPTSWGGTYMVTGCAVVEQTTSGAGSALLKVRKNNTTDVYESFDSWAISASTISVSLSGFFTVALVATDFVEIYYVNGTAANGTLRNDLGISLSAIWLHA